MFKVKPICEACGEKEAESFSFLPFDSDSSNGEWKFVCECTSESEHYYIPISNFFANPSATVDWMAHMNEKTWMDWSNFMNMMERFRKVTDSYGAL